MSKSIYDATKVIDQKKLGLVVVMEKIKLKEF